MSSCENVQSTEVGGQNPQNDPYVSESPSELNDEENEVEDDEDEDADFNPFLKEAASPQASSSLSFEIEGLGGDVAESIAKTHDTTEGNPSKPTSKVQNCNIEDPEIGEEESVMQSIGSPRKHEKGKHGYVSISERHGENGLLTNDGVVGDLDNVAHVGDSMMNLVNGSEDAICRRTRARYSLVGFTLDELEAFLQETDDDDDIQNVNDEEEYRKFLAAVLQGGDGDCQSAQENENVDDEDEDEENDADFEIELEEALESDYDQGAMEEIKAKEHERVGRRPETRQNRREKASAQNERKLLQQSKRPLRLLLPNLPNGRITCIPTLSGKNWMPETASRCLSSAAEDGLINGFSPHQIGQLHCLLYEHVQLLIQIFSLCVLDPSRQRIASLIKGLIFEMLQKRDEVISFRSKPYPDIFFNPPYVCSSVLSDVPLTSTAHCISKTSKHEANGLCSRNSQIPASQNISSCRQRCDCVSKGQECSSWVPIVNCPVLSVLDVAPLDLVGRYMDDAFAAVQEYQLRNMESSCDIQYEKEPLFPFSCIKEMEESNSEVFRGSTCPDANTVPTSVSQQPPKKTLAATLVERTKKQSVALVPKEIARLANRFFSLFNPALFPHKPPPMAVANRVLFTDSEDELLALGLMEYNSDWKAIQQRFLPCKSKHQIFVRQKNRCSAKAPENPIKAVRRMKTSPLTAEEMQGIQEGLKVFKLDWMSVWKCIVPHRDPSLLPRQWRIALGTQKSYKQDASKKEKRRLYELKRRQQKVADMADSKLASDKEFQAEYTGGENCSGDDNIDNADESNVHEEFSADWRQVELTSSEHPVANVRDKNPPNVGLAQEDTHGREKPNNYASIAVQPLTENLNGSPCTLLSSQHPVPNVTLNSSSQMYLRPYRSRKSNNPHIVKLAPDLPPVNLPPSVRVIPKSAFERTQCGLNSKISGNGSGIIGAGMGNIVPALPHLAKSASSGLLKAKSNPVKENTRNSVSEESGVVKEKSILGERSIASDLQMHPLLFQASEDGQLPYYPLSSGTNVSSSFSFFPGSQPQLNLSLFYNPQQINHVDSFNKSSRGKESASAPCGIDFHPLLQRTDDTNELGAACSTVPVSVVSERNFAQLHNPSAVLQMKSPVYSSPLVTRTRPSSPKEKVNDLDLEIHLSSLSRKENIAARTDMIAPPTKSKVNLLNSENPIKTQDTSCSSRNKLGSGSNASIAPSGNYTGYHVDDASDQSHPDIVMEQEELSDSDEEVEEHVEFECEEMADSEGEEGSGYEQTAEVAEFQDKEAPRSVAEKVATDADGDSDDKQWGSTDGHSQRSGFVLGKRRSPLQLCLTYTGKDANVSNSWLSLDTCAPGRKPEIEGNTVRKGPTTKILPSPRPNRFKPTSRSTKKTTAQDHALGMAEQLSLGPLSTTTLRKPRKRACRANTSLNMGSSKIDGKDNS